MFRSAMWASVCQAILLYTLSEIASNHLTERAIAGVDSPYAPELLGRNSSALAVDASGTDTEKSYYLSSLPRKVFVIAFLVPLSYYWNIWLERTFPARPKGGQVSQNFTSFAKIDANEQVEEEIVRKWIAQGKVQRSSISWKNTLIKWLLNISVGNAVASVLEIVLYGFARHGTMGKNIADELTTANMTFTYLSYVFSIESLASFISFLIIPAYKRVVFIAGISLLFNVFICGLLIVLVPWLFSFEGVRKGFEKSVELSRNHSMSMMNHTAVEHDL